MTEINGLSGQLGLLALYQYETEHDFSGLGPHDRRAPAHILSPTLNLFFLENICKFLHEMFKLGNLSPPRPKAPTYRAFKKCLFDSYLLSYYTGRTLRIPRITTSFFGEKSTVVRVRILNENIFTNEMIQIKNYSFLHKRYQDCGILEWNPVPFPIPSRTRIPSRYRFLRDTG